MESYIIGTISLFAGTFIPEEFLECNGAALDLVQYQVLYNVIGTKFGGDGITTFNLPTLAPPIVGVIYMICLNGAYPEMPRDVKSDAEVAAVVSGLIAEAVLLSLSVNEDVVVSEVAKSSSSCKDDE